MRATWKFGRLAGVEIGVHWTVLFIIALLTWSLGAGVLPDSATRYSTFEYWAAAAIVALAFGASILAHEMSHAVVAGREGVPVDSIVLWMFGGMAKLKSQALTASAELRIALAGPAMSVAIGAAPWGSLPCCRRAASLVWRRRRWRDSVPSISCSQCSTSCRAPHSTADESSPPCCGGEQATSNGLEEARRQRDGSLARP